MEDKEGGCGADVEIGRQRQDVPVREVDPCWGVRNLTLLLFYLGPSHCELSLRWYGILPCRVLRRRK